MTKPVFGFIGLGSMGAPMARHVSERGFELIVNDIAGSAERAPTGATPANSNLEVAERADVIALSLPDVASNQQVVREIAQCKRPGQVVIDTCTIGWEASTQNHQLLEQNDIGYVDSPVSGLQFRAEQGELASMAAGADDHFDKALPLIDCYSRVVHRVGSTPGQGQRMKVVNNALYIASLVCTSEALACGEDGGLSMRTMLSVINDSSGQNFATTHILNQFLVDGISDSGADAQVLEKDLGLFVKGASQESRPHETIARAYDIIETFCRKDPRQDMMHLYGYIKEDSQP